MSMITTKENQEFLKTTLSKDFPFVSTNRYTLGGEQNASIGITISNDVREKWTNNILENSSFAKFMLDSDGKIQMLCSYKTPKFRASKVKDIQHAIDRIQQWKAAV